MTDWKAGDFAMVEIARSGDEHAVVLVGPRGHECLIRPEYLTPLPPTKTAAEAALIDRCVAMNWQESPNMHALVSAVLAERAPPDPVEVGMAAYRSNGALTHIEGMVLAFKAYDEAKGRKS